MPPHVFEIAPSYLRYACIERSADGFVAKTYREVELSPEAFSTGPLGGPVRDLGRLDRAISEVLEASQVKAVEASLLLPDAWMRTVAVEVGGDSPKVPREELLRWRLKPLVPFRVEELRVEGVELGGSASRLLVGFAVDQLVAEIEDRFAAAGVRLGLITSRGLSLMWALRDLGQALAIALLDEGGYSLTIVKDGQPMLVRHRGLPPFALDEGQIEHVRRDLRLTRESLGEEGAGVLLCAPPGAAETWLPLLEEGLSAHGAVLTIDHLRAVRVPFALPVETLAPMLGAAAAELR